MNDLLVALTPISFLGFIVLIGYCIEKTGFVTNINEKLSKLILHVTLPALVITSISSQRFLNTSYWDMLYIVIIGVVAIFGLLILNFGVARILRVKKDHRLIHAYLGSFGNVIFLGYPFIYILFGDIGLFYAIIFSIVNDMILWTFGVYFLHRGSNLACSDRMTAKRLILPFLNPNTISFLLGMSKLLLKIQLPEIIHAPLSSIGSTTTPLSMLFIGAILAKMDLKEAAKNIPIWWVCMLKMVLFPMSIIFILRFCFSMLIDTHQILFSVAILQIAMPTQVILSVLADRYNADTKYVTQTIFITTLVSIITLPFVYYLCLKLV